MLAARYTHTRCLMMLVCQEKFFTRSTAGKREYEIKQMAKKEKLMLIDFAHTTFYLRTVTLFTGYGFTIRADFNGGGLSSDLGSLLLCEVDRQSTGFSPTFAIHSPKPLFSMVF